jgi:hypothetical protein
MTRPYLAPELRKLVAKRALLNPQFSLQSGIIRYNQPIELRKKISQNMSNQEKQQLFLEFMSQHCQEGKKKVQSKQLKLHQDKDVTTLTPIKENFNYTASYHYLPSCQ